jgi:hypothetical protein
MKELAKKFQRLYGSPRIIPDGTDHNEPDEVSLLTDDDIVMGMVGGNAVKSFTPVPEVLKLHKNCMNCGKPLTSEAAKTLGYGPDCLGAKRLRIGLVTNRWMTFNDCDEPPMVAARWTYGEAVDHFKIHAEEIEAYFSDEMMNFFAKIEAEHNLDAIWVLPAALETNEGKRAWILFRNSQAPYEWHDALSKGEMEYTWARTYMNPVMWLIHEQTRLDDQAEFSVVNLASHSDKTHRESLSISDSHIFQTIFDDFSEQMDGTDEDPPSLDDLEEEGDDVNWGAMPSSLTNLLEDIWIVVKHACRCDSMDELGHDEAHPCEWCYTTNPWSSTWIYAVMNGVASAKPGAGTAYEIGLAEIAREMRSWVEVHDFFRVPARPKDIFAHYSQYQDSGFMISVPTTPVDACYCGYYERLTAAAWEDNPEIEKCTCTAGDVGGD